MGVSEVHKDRCGHIAIGSLSVIVKIPEWRRNPDFPAPEGPISICLRACGSFQRNTLRIVIVLATLTREA